MKRDFKWFFLLAAIVLASVAAEGADGFYHVGKGADGRWEIFDGDGRRTFLRGVNLIRYDGCRSRGRRRYQEWNNAHYPSRDAWAAETVGRLKDWGFNMIGSGDGNLLHRGLVHTLNVSMGDSLCGPKCEDELWICPNPGKPCAAFPNVFSPRFRPSCDRIAERVCRPRREDRELLGYFTDNELAWWGRGARDTGLYEAALKLPPTHTARQALEKFAAARGEDPQKASSATKLAFLREAAEIYFRETSAAIRAADPNHLVLGARFAGLGGAHDVVWEVSGKYCDAVTFNTYPWADIDRNVVLTSSQPNFARRVADVFAEQAAKIGKPFIITEWSFPALDSGLPCTHGAGQRFDTQDERTRATELFARTMLASPAVVGYIYFMWTDEPPEGVTDVHPEDTNYGLVNERGEPYPITDMFARLHRGWEGVRDGGLPLERPAPPRPPAPVAAEIRAKCTAVAKALADLPSAQFDALSLPEPKIGDKFVLRDIMCRNCVLGDHTVMVSYMKDGSRRWQDAARVTAVEKLVDGDGWRVRVAWSECEYGFEVIEEIRRYTSAPFFLAEIVEVRNTGKIDLDLHSVYFREYAPYAKECGATGRKQVPNRWHRERHADRWVAPDGRWYGASSSAATAVRFFFRWENGSQHPDTVFQPESPTLLKPGESYRPNGTMWCLVSGGAL